MIPFALVSLCGSAVSFLLLAPLGLPAALVGAPVAGSALGIGAAASWLGRTRA
jgi:hypothetical protein